MKKLLITLAVSTAMSYTYAQIGVFGTDANGNTTEKCSDAGWDKSDCSLTKIKIGEVIPDKKEVDCDGVSKTIYETLADGKPMLILVEAWGCPPCWASAPEKSDFMLANKSKINFWVPISEYFGNDAVCATNDVNDRRSIRGWENAFPGFKDSYMFLDNDRTYNLIGIPAQPGVGVFDPKTKKLVYSGYDFKKASEMALELANNVTSTFESEMLEFSFSPNPANSVLNITTQREKNAVQILTLNGKTVMENEFSGNTISLSIEHLNKGVYILKINNKAEQLVIQ